MKNKDKPFSNPSLEIVNYINSLGSFPIVGQNSALSQRPLTLRGKLASKTFQLVVLGQFKRGKTSFINALSGEDLLPTAVVPLTSIITILKYGKEGDHPSGKLSRHLSVY